MPGSPQRTPGRCRPRLHEQIPSRSSIVRKPLTFDPLRQAHPILSQHIDGIAVYIIWVGSTDHQQGGEGSGGNHDGGTLSSDQDNVRRSCSRSGYCPDDHGGVAASTSLRKRIASDGPGRHRAARSTKCVATSYGTRRPEYPSTGPAIPSQPCSPFRLRKGRVNPRQPTFSPLPPTRSLWSPVWSNACDLERSS